MKTNQEITNECFNKLKEFIEIPEYLNVVGLSLNLSVDTIPTITIKSYINDKHLINKSYDRRDMTETAFKLEKIND